MVDFVRELSEQTEIPQQRIISWVGISRGKFFDWRQRYGKANEHNALVPRDHWLTPDEQKAIIDFFGKHPLEGYRRLTFMMLDADVVAASPATVYRVLSRAGLLSRWNVKPSKRGTGFVQPLRPHEHWHVDISYLKIACTGYSTMTREGLMTRIAQLEAALEAERERARWLEVERDKLKAAYRELQVEHELLRRRIFAAKAERVDTSQLELELAERKKELDELAAKLGLDTSSVG